MTVFPHYLWFLSPQIVKTANTKTANSEGRGSPASAFCLRSIISGLRIFHAASKGIRRKITLFEKTCEGYKRPNAEKETAKAFLVDS
jgi:hypothetical protein